MKYVMAISEDRVPSTKAPDPYMHIFFDAGKGSCLAFFEVKDRRTLLGKLRRLAPRTLHDWSASKKTVRHAAFLHAREFAATK